MFDGFLLLCPRYRFSKRMSQGITEPFSINPGREKRLAPLEANYLRSGDNRATLATPTTQSEDPRAPSLSAYLTDACVAGEVVSLSLRNASQFKARPFALRIGWRGRCSAVPVIAAVLLPSLQRILWSPAGSSSLKQEGGRLSDPRGTP